MPKLHERKRAGTRKEVIHERTRDIVCPVCGWIETNSWEYNDGEKLECPECDVTFSVIIDESETFSTVHITEDGPAQGD